MHDVTYHLYNRLCVRGWKHFSLLQHCEACIIFCEMEENPVVKCVRRRLLADVSSCTTTSTTVPGYGHRTTLLNPNQGQSVVEQLNLQSKICSLNATHPALSDRASHRP
ncbi:hypothetical protein BaRGS_00027283 [Batillaria attramentaria]|uniref:Uncharacterized protein n=1 Tax=Batillaria attramentaria TaxID=370345 RepID=A0ABD0K2K0_9CAEN